MCWRQVEFVGILKNSPHRDLAEKFVDFLFSKEFQEDVPMQMFVSRPARGSLTGRFRHCQSDPEVTGSLDPALIAQNRDQWINDWTETVIN